MGVGSCFTPLETWASHHKPRTELQLTVNSEVFLYNKQVRITEEMINVISTGTVKICNRWDQLEVVTVERNKHLSCKILMSNYNADDFSGRVTPRNSSHLLVVFSCARSPTLWFHHNFHFHFPLPWLNINWMVLCWPNQAIKSCDSPATLTDAYTTKYASFHVSSHPLRQWYNTLTVWNVTGCVFHLSSESEAERNMLAVKTAEKLLKDLKGRPGDVRSRLLENMMLVQTKSKSNIERALQQFMEIATEHVSNRYHWLAITIVYNPHLQ